MSLGEAAACGQPGCLPGARKASMDLLTIGSFARAARLSPKALRLYDELGLLTSTRYPATGSMTPASWSMPAWSRGCGGSACRLPGSA